MTPGAWWEAFAVGFAAGAVALNIVLAIGEHFQRRRRTAPTAQLLPRWEDVTIEQWFALTSQERQGVLMEFWERTAAPPKWHRRYYVPELDDPDRK